MPVIKSAKKKLRQDKKRQFANKKMKTAYKDLLKTTKLNPTKEAVEQTVSSLDKAAKNGIIHKNKAARLKSALAKLAKNPVEKKTEVKPQKAATPAKKTTSKK